MTTRVERILVVLPNWLGDLVMSLPCLDLLARAAAAAARPVSVHAVVRRRWASLLQGDPRLQGCLLYERTGRHRGVAGTVRLAGRWRALHADAVLVVPPSLRMAAAAALARIPVRVGQATDGRAWLLTHPVPPTTPRGARHYADEVVDLGRRLLDACGLPSAGIAPEPPRLPGLVARPGSHPGPGPAVWALAPGTTYGPAKTWPAARVAEFITRAVNEVGVRVLMLGDASARDLAGDVRRRASVPWRDRLAGEAGVVDLVGRTGVVDAADLLRGCVAFVGNDSGLMHLAAALDVPTVGIFGSSSPAWTAPRGRRTRALTARGFACQPCFRATCNQPRFCLDTVTADEVLAAVREVVGAELREEAP